MVVGVCVGEGGRGADDSPTPYAKLFRKYVVSLVQLLTYKATNFLIRISI